jgi:hypothetical protein
LYGKKKIFPPPLNFTDFFSHQSMVAIKTSRDSYKKYWNVSGSLQGTLKTTATYPRIDSPDTTGPKFEIENLVSPLGEPEVEIRTKTTPIKETNITDIAQPSPAPFDPPDSVQKPENKILGKFGTYELNMVVFAAFTFMVGNDMALNKLLSTGTIGFGKNLYFAILYALGYIPAC